MTPEEALEKAISIVGSQQGLAEILGISKGAVNQWQLPGRRVPAEHCQVIEEAVNGLVTREQLRPDIYLRKVDHIQQKARRKEDRP